MLLKNSIRISTFNNIYKVETCNLKLNSCILIYAKWILEIYTWLSDPLIKIFLIRISSSALQTEFYIYSHYMFSQSSVSIPTITRRWAIGPTGLTCESKQRCNPFPDLHNLPLWLVDHINTVAIKVFEDSYQFIARI